MQLKQQCLCLCTKVHCSSSHKAKVYKPKRVFPIQKKTHIFLSSPECCLKAWRGWAALTLHTKMWCLVSQNFQVSFENTLQILDISTEEIIGCNLWGRYGLGKWCLTTEVSFNIAFFCNYFSWGLGTCSRQPLSCSFSWRGPKTWQPSILSSKQQCVQLSCTDRELFRQNP